MNLDIKNIFIDQKTSKLTPFQKIVLDITFDFMNLTEENFDERVEHLLERLGIFFQVDQTYLFTINHKKDSMVYSHDWSTTGVSPLVGTKREIQLARYPWWVNQLTNNRLVQIENVREMPVEANVEQEQLSKQGIKSLLAVPVFAEEKIQAFIGINSFKCTDKWTEENIEHLQIMGKFLSKGIIQLNNIKKVNFLSYHDPLTELPNRLLLTTRLEQDNLQANSQNPLISIMFINLDGFKVINDNFGYEQGDALLKQASKRLLEIVSKKDTVCRTDGDQFILYIGDYQDQESLDGIATQIINAFNKPFILRGEEYNITASMGISQYFLDGKNVEDLIKYAYMAMNKAKCLGKNQYQHCTTQIKEEALETIYLTNDLYKAIERDEMLLHYQPQVNGLTGEIVGIEALLRWDHPKLGFIPPFKFIPLAEKTQLILSIGYWVLESAAKQFKEWQKNGYKPIKIAVNFSMYQLSHPHIIEEIKEILERYSLEAKYLEVEVTESLAMDKNHVIKENLRKIKELGASLSIDDFGKEYSSFNRLKESPMDTIKIDMSFVQGIGICVEDEGIVKSVLSLAKNLGLKTVAEGVETKEQADFLNKTACDHLQGYYFHKPMAPAEMEKLLTVHS